MVHYKKLESTFRRLHRLGHLEAMAGWDRAVMMPSGGAEARAAAMAELSVIITEMLQSPELADQLDQAFLEMGQLNEWQKANLREMKRVWMRANSIRVDLVQAKSLAGARCEHAWRELRSQNNWKDFLPLFDEVVRLAREEASQRAQATGLSPYDAMLDLYEPGLLSARLEPLFEQLKSFLPEFIFQVVEKQKSETVIRPEGPFATEKQRSLGLELMKKVGFDFDHGRLDVSHHPFCGGVPQDVRLTTRYVENDFSESLMGVLHETGHARYEQGLPRQWMDQPVGSARSMSIHESQSLLFEMQMARGFDFLTFATPIMKIYLGKMSDSSAAWTPDNLFKLYTRVVPDYIRVNADEVTYPAHVILRYELEKDLIGGRLEPVDLPEAWDQKMQKYLGLSTANNYKDGCMQDIHWTDGTFGYFPTYTLGAMTAAQIFAAAQREISDLSEQIQQGQFLPLNAWLGSKVWSQGSLFSVDDLVQYATGEKLNSVYFIEHLKKRYIGKIN